MKIQELFNVPNLKASIVSYFNVVKDISTPMDMASKKDFECGYNLLNDACFVSSPALYYGILQNAAIYFTNATAKEEQKRLLMAYLGLLICYAYLNEREAFVQIQNKVRNLTFKPTFWGKNGPDIKMTGTALLGILMTVASGGSAAMGAGLGAKGSTMVKEDAMKELEAKKEAFNALRDEISNLQLNFII